MLEEIVETYSDNDCDEDLKYNEGNKNTLPEFGHIFIVVHNKGDRSGGRVVNQTRRSLGISDVDIRVENLLRLAAI